MSTSPARSSHYDAIVIGGGHNGLTCAATICLFHTINKATKQVKRMQMEI